MFNRTSKDNFLPDWRNNFSLLGNNYPVSVDGQPVYRFNIKEPEPKLLHV